MTNSQSPTGIEVKAGFMPLMLLLFFCSPRVVINGYEYRARWGTNFFPTEPGWYHVEVYFPYLFPAKAGANSIDVYVCPGYVTTIDYYMAVPWVFAKGSIRQL